MQTIYLAGPIAGCTTEESRAWRNVVKSELTGLYEFKDPTVRLKEDGISDLEIVAGDKLDIVESDIVFANYWKTAATGTAMEIMFTHMLDRRRLIITVVPKGLPVSPWITIHSDFVFSSLDKAISYLRNQK